MTYTVMWFKPTELNMVFGFLTSVSRIVRNETFTLYVAFEIKYIIIIIIIIANSIILEIPVLIIRAMYACI